MSFVRAYAFNARSLDEPRKPGISALMRIRNGADFLRLAIESHLPYYDEIIACYNDCSDATEPILRELASLHPDRIRLLPYLPKVHPPRSAEHNCTATDSPHSLANYYNYALAQARYSVAVKLDDDHLAISGALDTCVRRIRADVARGHRRLYTFSGLNLVRAGAAGLAVYGNEPLAGTGDIMYFPVCSKIYWRQATDYEQLGFSELRLQKEYMGLLYFHLKHLKPDFGFGNLGNSLRHRAEESFLRTLDPVSLAEFCADDYQQRLRRRHGQLEYWLRTNPLVRGLLFALFDRHPPLRILRLQELPEHLASIDWERDLFGRLNLGSMSSLARTVSPRRRTVSGETLADART